MAKKTFLLELEKRAGLAPPDIYNRMGWGRQRYFYHRNHSFPPARFGLLRKAVGWDREKFYKYVGEFFESKS